MTFSIASVLEDVSHIMLTQGPLEFFVHHNTFHAFESEAFRSGLEKGQVLYGAKVYRSIAEYNDSFQQGQIAEKFIRERLSDLLGGSFKDKREILELARTLLFMPGNESVVFTAKPPGFKLGLHRSKKEFYREILLMEYGIDIDDAISHTLLTFFAAYFDQGYSYWPMPDREKGMLACFCTYILANQSLSAPWIKRLAKKLKELKPASNEDRIVSLIQELQIGEDDAAEFLFSLGYRYKGWGALNLSFLENKNWNRSPESIKADFSEFMLILLLVESSIVNSVFAHLETPFKYKVPRVVYIKEYSDAIIESLTELQLKLTEDEFQNFASRVRDIDRQYVLQCAYEDTFYQKFLQSFSDRQKRVSKVPVGDKVKFQVICCIDDREESFRRYIEEVEPNSETFGVAGHFGLDIRFKGIFNAFPRALCPNIVTPTKTVEEELLQNKDLRQLIGMWADLLWLESTGSKGLLRGYFMQFIVSIFAFFPLAFSIFSPRLASAIRKKVRLGLLKRLKTELRFREDETSAGMKIEDQTNYAKNLLKTIGLTENFSPFVLLLGHGSSSLNNPHESAYNCGACGGGRGGPNSRLMAKILNSQKIRENLRTQFAIHIPEKTVFVGGYHNTCSDEILFSDAPDTEDFKNVVDCLQKAAYQNARERCRRFDDIGLNVNDVNACTQVRSRASDYRQPRPEYNHATNALCIIGPRELTRDLFLDRRSFLVSYNSKGDPSGDILRNILSAVGPVCSGINLEYYFSCVDNEILGCGTKLPHNVTSLLGVMNGFESDLQLGLSAQMVEIHDPYRLMVLVAAPLDVVDNLVETLPSFNCLVKNQWIHLRVFEPISKKIYEYSNNAFHEVVFVGTTPVVKNSYLAFAGQRGSCEFVSMGDEGA